MYLFLINFGINPLKIPEGIKGLWLYRKDYAAFKRRYQVSAAFPKINLHPIFGNRFQQGGVLSGHYFHQDLYMARKIYHARPDHHLDIGSRTDGFIAHLAVFMPVEIMDIRPITGTIQNITYVQADLTTASFPLIDYTASISCLHAIEHFGLGRYGDPIDPDGYLKGWNNIYACLKRNGVFYFSTPIGQPRIEFNAHRVFSMTYLLSLIESKYDILSFAYIDDAGDLHAEASLDKEAVEKNFNCTYGCALFELKKI